MTDSLNEQLSACLDGQLPEGELDLLLKRVGRDAQLRRTLGRYSLVGEALRGHGAAQASSGFADRVAAAIAAEGASGHAGAKPNSAVMRWLRPAAGLAVAASVAAVAVFTFQLPTPESTAVVAQQAPIAATDTDTDTAAADSYIVPANPVSNFIPAARLTNYVVAHSEYSSPLGRRTVLSGVLSEEDDDANGTTADAAPGEQAQAPSVAVDGQAASGSAPQQ